MGRVLVGLLAGVAGGAVMNIWSLLVRYLGISETWNAQLMARAIFHRPAHTVVEYLVAVVYDLIFAGAIGVVLALSVPLVGIRDLRVIGWFLGVATSLMNLIVASSFRIPVFHHLKPRSILSHFVTASVWGLAASHVLLRLMR